MSGNNQTIDLGAAKIIEGNDQIRADNCLAKVKRILKQYDCQLLPVVTIAGNSIKTDVMIQAIPREHPLA